MYIAAMDENGFAAKSGKLQVQDRILACNGTDFTKNMTNRRVEEIFTAMLKEPLLRMAISRGGYRGSLQGNKGSGSDVMGGVADKEEGGRAGDEVGGVAATAAVSAVEARDGSGLSLSGITVAGEERGVAVGGAGDDSSPSGTRPTIKIVGEFDWCLCVHVSVCVCVCVCTHVCLCM